MGKRYWGHRAFIRDLNEAPESSILGRLNTPDQRRAFFDWRDMNRRADQYENQATETVYGDRPRLSDPRFSSLRDLLTPGPTTPTEPNKPAFQTPTPGTGGPAFQTSSGISQAWSRPTTQSMGTTPLGGGGMFSPAGGDNSNFLGGLRNNPNVMINYANPQGIDNRWTMGNESPFQGLQNNPYMNNMMNFFRSPQGLSMLWQMMGPMMMGRGTFGRGLASAWR